MRSLVAFICLAQLLSYNAARSFVLPPVRDPNCDDPDVEQAALAAVQYINSNHKHGYKFTLNQVDKARVYQRRPSGEIYSLEIDLLETTCHVLDPTPLENCTVRQLAEHGFTSPEIWLALRATGLTAKAVEGDCDFSVLKSENQFVVLNAKCKSSPDSAEDVRKVCPNCALLVPLNDTKVVHTVDVALAAFNNQNHNNYFKLLEISRAQIAPGQSSIYAEFVIAPTDCASKDVPDPVACNLLPDQYGFCKATLTEKVGGEDVAVSCTVFGNAPVVPAPQPDGGESTVAAGPTVAAEPAMAAESAVAAGPVVAEGPAVALGPLLLPVQPLVKKHLPLHDLRHSIVGAGSFESASGEHGLAPGPAAAGPGLAAPAIPICPGRIRYFKV